MYEKNNVAIKVQVCDKCISSEMREEKKFVCERESEREEKRRKVKSDKSQNFRTIPCFPTTE